MDSASDVIVLVTDQLDLTKWVDTWQTTDTKSRVQGKAIIHCFKCRKYGLISLECQEWEIHITEWEEELDGPFYVVGDDQRGSVENLGADYDVI